MAVRRVSAVAALAQFSRAKIEIERRESDDPIFIGGVRHDGPPIGRSLSTCKCFGNPGLLLGQWTSLTKSFLTFGLSLDVLTTVH